DNNLVGVGPSVILSIGWRRNGTANAGAPKTTDLTVTMSHADYALVTNTFAANYKDTPQVVFVRKPVNLPDWNAPSSSVPSPMDVILPLDVPFIYNRVDALLYDVQNENNPLGIYTQDWVSGTPTHVYGSFPTNLGVGCTTQNGVMTHRTALRASSTMVEAGFSVEQGPPHAAVVLLLGTSDPNLPVGLCTTLRTLPIIDMPLGVTDASGRRPMLFNSHPIRAPWQQSFASLTFYTQTVAMDYSRPGIPIVLSNGVRAPMPATSGPGDINVKRIYHTSSATAPTGTGPSVSAVPTLYIGI
ncbi:MAG TPA: hypothetical protein VK081_11185, partial [Planctomycetota bacterium]|nr:hypothetical protein [Planctomycetota bacterium]